MGYGLAVMRAAVAVLLLLLMQAPGVREFHGLAYREGPGADAARHRLDLYLPQDKPGFPLLMFIHGGGWMSGDRGEYAGLGRRFAESGVGFAAISYRLSPGVKHPAHVEDCARAFQWLHAHVEEYGGSRDRLFVAGHSAGGHLATLLATDPSYLKTLDLPPGVLKGAIAISGIYAIPALPPETQGPQEIIAKSFGSDPEVCRAASPLQHLPGLALPMLVITETEESAEARKEAESLKTAAEKNGVKSIRFLDAEHRNHATVVSRMALKEEDPSRTAILDFIRAHSGKQDPPK